MRLKQIDETTRGDHSFISADDECYYFGDYTAGKGWAFSPMNQLIMNLKKDVSLRGTRQWDYKEQAIRQVGVAFRGVFNPQALPSMTFVPVPPSKAKNDPEYDDRMLRVLQQMAQADRLDIRELVLQAKEHASCTQKRDPTSTARTEGALLHQRGRRSAGADQHLYRRRYAHCGLPLQSDEGCSAGALPGRCCPGSVRCSSCNS